MEANHNGDSWRLLVVEDDPEQARTMKRLLAKRFRAGIDMAQDLASARTALATADYDAVVTDYQLPDGSGLDLLKEVTSNPSHPPVILVTGQGDEDVAAEAFRLHASGYIVKDSRLPQMVPQVVARALNEVSLKRAEEALFRSEQNQRALLDATPETLMLVDMEGRILTINETGARRLGHSPDEMVGKPLMGFLEPELSDSRQEQFDRLAETFEPVRFEDERNGVVFSHVLYPVTGKSGEVERVAIFSRDVTKQRKSEEELRVAHEDLEERVLERTAQLRKANEDLKAEIEVRSRAEESLRALSQSVQEQARVLDQILSAGPQHFYLFDEKGKFIYASKQAADLLGRPQADFSGTYWWDLGFPESVMKTLDIERENVRKAAEPWTGMLKFPTPQGIRDFEYTLSPIVRADGKVDTVVASARDVTDEKRASEELASRTVKLREQAQLLDLTHETIIVRDRESRITFWNAGAEEIWGWKREEAIGKDQFELLRTQFDMPLDELEEILLQDGRWEGELLQTTKDGTRLSVASRQVVKWAEGHVFEGVLEIDTDISDRRALQDELERRVATLEHQAHLLSLIPSPVFVTDMNSVITFWNAAAVEAFGWTAEEAVGQVSHDLLKTEFSKPLADVEFDLVNDGAWEGDLVHTAKDGRRLTGHSRWALEWDESHEPSAIIEVVC